MNVGLVGCGRWGVNILRDLQALGCRVWVAGTEDSRRRAESAGAQGTFAAIAQLPAVAGIVIAVPTAVHAAAIEEAAERGVPLFVEKPLTADVASAERLAARLAGRLFVMDKWRYHPGVEALAAIARRGELGRVRGLVTARLGWGNPHADVDGVWVLAPHDLSIALEVFGRVPEPRAARGVGGPGPASHLVALLGDDPWHCLEVSTVHPAHRREVRLECSEGAAVLDDGYADAISIVRYDRLDRPAAEAVERRPVSTELPLLRELRAFVEHLRGGPAPRSSAAEGAAVVRAVAEMRRLARLPEARP